MVALIFFLYNFLFTGYFRQLSRTTQYGYLLSHFLTLTDLFIIVLAVMDLLFNTRIYNLVSVPQITRFLLEDAINSSKTDTQNGSKNEKRSYGKVKNNKTISKILPFIRILYFKQQPVFCDALQVKI